MGLAASQCRLLNLTSRLSDLELRAQTISNSKIRLAMDSEEASTEYSDALNKEKLSIYAGSDANGDKIYKDLTYDNLTGVNSPLLSQYGLSRSNGDLLVKKDIATKFKQSSSKIDFLSKFGQTAEVTVYPAGVTEEQYNKAKGLVDTTQAAYSGPNGAQAKTAKDLVALDKYAKGDGTAANPAHVEGYTTAGAWSYKTQVASAGRPSPELLSQLSKVVTQANTLFTRSQDTVAKAVAAQKEIAKYDSPMSMDAQLAYSSAAPAVGDANAAFGAALKFQMDAMKAMTSPTKTNIDALSISSNLASQAVIKAMNSIGFVASHAESAAGVMTQAQLMNPVTPKQIAAKAAIAAQTSAQSTGATSTVASQEVKKTVVIPLPAPTTNDITYNSKDNPDKIKFINGGTKDNYDKLLNAYKADVTAEAAAKTAYDNAKKAFSDLGTPTKNTVIKNSPEATYYENLYNRMQGGHYFTEQDETTTTDSKEWIQSQIMNGNLILEKVDSKGQWSSESYGSDSNIIEKTDKADQAKAEAKYNATMAQIQRKDKTFDLQLKNIDTEHSATQTEIESVKKVIDGNIQRAFKMFQA